MIKSNLKNAEVCMPPVKSLLDSEASVDASSTALFPPQVNGWESEDIYSSAHNYFNDFLVDIDHAVSTIEMAFYIFSAESIGNNFLDSLASASSRGVKVRLLIDGIGSADDSEIIVRKLTAAGVQVRIFHPLPWYLSNYRWSLKTGGVVEKFFHFFTSINQRDHRKFCVVDHTIAWCGSFNICPQHLDEADPWRDYGVRLMGKAVPELIDNFNGVWFHHEQKVTEKLLRFVRSNTSERMRRLRNRLLIQRISNASNKVWICNAYFSPTRALIKAIITARARDVDVRLIVAVKSDVGLFPLLSATYYANLLENGVSVYCYQKGMLHAKVLLIDNTCVIGSTNLNHRSFYHDIELDVVLSMDSSIHKMKCLLEQDMQNSSCLRPDNVSHLKHPVIIGWLLWLFRNWL